jgi:hypothetical protein
VVVAIIGVVNILLGAYSVTREDLTFLMVGIGIYNVIEGAIYCILAYFVRRKSLAAISIALGLYIIDWITLFITAARLSNTNSGLGSALSGGTVTRILVVIVLIQGVKAAKGTKKPIATEE